MAEITPAGGGPNRLFIALALGLAALLVLGLVGLGGFFAIQTLFKGAAPTRIALATPTQMPTALPTETSEPTEVATPTLVLSAVGAGETETAVALAATPAETETPQATPDAVSSGELPQSGLGEDLLLLAGGVVLVMVVFVARRVRMT